MWYVRNRCHDLLMMSMNFSDIATLSIKSADYHCIITWISKSEPINLMQNQDLTGKKQNIIKHKNLLSNIKMDKKISTFGDIEFEKNKIYCCESPNFSEK